MNAANVVRHKLFCGKPSFVEYEMVEETESAGELSVVSKRWPMTLLRGLNGRSNLNAYSLTQILVYVLCNISYVTVTPYDVSVVSHDEIWCTREFWVNKRWPLEISTWCISWQTLVLLLTLRIQKPSQCKWPGNANSRVDHLLYHLQQTSATPKRASEFDSVQCIGIKHIYFFSWSKLVLFSGYDIYCIWDAIDD